MNPAALVFWLFGALVGAAFDGVGGALTGATASAGMSVLASAFAPKTALGCGVFLVLFLAIPAIAVVLRYNNLIFVGF